METPLTENELLEQISSSDPELRTEAWLRAGEVGAAAIRPLAALLTRNAPLVDRQAKELAQLEMSGNDVETREKIAAKQEQLQYPMEVSRAAKRALSKIVRHAGRPGAGSERTAVVNELLRLLEPGQLLMIRREAISMLSEIADDQAVTPLAALLNDPELREDARVALERIPSGQSLDALRAGLAAVPDDFKINIAQSLRARGVDLPK
jgi:HEAT repeat protein